MIDQIDQQLQEWIQEKLNIVASLAVPAEPPKGRTVTLYLLKLSERPVPRGPQRAPLEVTLHYLITTWADTPAEAHQMLGTLLFAAMEHPDFEVTFDPLPTNLWNAFGIPPRPAFILCVPLRHERPEPPAPRVRVPLAGQLVPIASLEGRILGNKDIPLANALIEYPALQVTTRTDSEGRFHLPDLPAELSGPRRLRIQARKKTFEITLNQPAKGEPLIIRLDLLNDSEKSGNIP